KLLKPAQNLLLPSDEFPGCDQLDLNVERRNWNLNASNVADLERGDGLADSAAFELAPDSWVVIDEPCDVFGSHAFVPQADKHKRRCRNRGNAIPHVFRSLEPTTARAEHDVLVAQEMCGIDVAWVGIVGVDEV